MISWLQGGPFLELSFVTTNCTKLETIINQIQNMDVKITVENQIESLQEFYRGYSYDVDDPNSKIMHSITLNITVHTIRQRRALLIVEKFGSDLLFFSMCFFGDLEDAPEWSQPGIRCDEVYEFRSLLILLFKELKFSVGGLAIEEDVKTLFETEGEWPYEQCTLSNVKLGDNLSKFLTVIVDELLKDVLTEINYKHLDNSGILIEVN
ncbi:hypothetical protein [Paenibacillus sp. NPDC057967]|uniref:hypothetical protein n=1 Tax=Paenibacillus sp. NPDC057967 TaxID=3346293 RepID=UPI0036DAB911